MVKRRFKPGLLPTIVTVLMLFVLVSLGTWQINRSVEKKALIESFEQAPDMSPVTLAELRNDWGKYRFRKISLDGSYDGGHQILLENQIHNRQSGFMVLTPFRLANSNNYVLVNRGWLERDSRVARLPDISFEKDSRAITGLVSHPPGVGIKLGSLNQSPMSWPKPIPYIDMDWLGLQLGAKVLPWIVLLGKEEPNGYLREWRPAIAVRMPPEKHQGYAFQWYSLAIVLVFLFVAGSLKPEGKVNKDDE